VSDAWVAECMLRSAGMCVCVCVCVCSVGQRLSGVHMYVSGERCKLRAWISACVYVFFGGGNGRRERRG
jgi:hypothetical protein